MDNSFQKVNNSKNPNDNLWMSIITGAKEDNIDDMYASDKLLQTIADVSNFIIKERKVPKHQAREIATNIVTAHALRHQREYSPNGHRALIGNVVPEHPALEGFRSDVRKMITNRVSHAASKIFIVSFFIGSLFGGILSLLLF